MTFGCHVPMGGITVLLSSRGHHSYYRFVNSTLGLYTAQLELPLSVAKALPLEFGVHTH